MFLSRATAWQYKAEEPYIQEVTSLAQEAGAVTTDDGFHYALLEKQVCCMPETELWFFHQHFASQISMRTRAAQQFCRMRTAVGSRPQPRSDERYTCRSTYQAPMSRWACCAVWHCLALRFLPGRLADEQDVCAPLRCARSGGCKNERHSEL